MLPFKAFLVQFSHCAKFRCRNYSVANGIIIHVTAITISWHLIADPWNKRTSSWSTASRQVSITNFNLMVRLCPSIETSRPSPNKKENRPWGNRMDCTAERSRLLKLCALTFPTRWTDFSRELKLAVNYSNISKLPSFPTPPPLPDTFPEFFSK